ncbi:MAG TPA: inositol monophosphatase family protein [Thermoleophilaceae bacterium]|nr:inositol monophosphatase family protein [Thermoleophilaceae bacterium]
MPSADQSDPMLAADWLAVCRRITEEVRAALARYPTPEDRARTTGRGEGGDLALVIDRGAEDAVFAELESLDTPLTVVSEERGHVAIRGGGPIHVVVDPVDGSLNAKRRLPFHCLSIAVASGPTMEDVDFAYIAELAAGAGASTLSAGGEWWARRGEGAFADGEPLSVLDRPASSPGIEVLAFESANPLIVAALADELASTRAHRLRALGAIALALCLVAGGRADAMTSLAPCRSVDAAAGQLIVREAGGVVTFPDAGGSNATPLDLEMRSRVMAAWRQEELETLLEAFGGAVEREQPAR